jgi:hypothetical protein
MTMPGLGLGGSLSLFGLQPTPTITFSFSGDIVDSVGISPNLLTTMGAPLAELFKIAVALPISTGTSGTVLTTSSGACTATFVGFGMNDGIFINTGLLDVNKRYHESDAFGIGINLADTEVIRPGRIISEVVHMQEMVAPNLRYVWTVAEQLFMAQSLKAAVPIIMSDGIGVAPALRASIAVTVLQGLGIAAAPLPSLKYTQTLLQGLGVSDSFRNFFGGSLTDGIGVTAALAKQFRPQPILADGVGIAPALSQHFYIRVTIEDSITLDDASILNAIYAGELADGIQVVAGYVSPNGQFTTWVMNTRTGAVTEYQNYAFNSFGQLGDVYLGASSTGLYKLIGDDDDGTDIIADIKSGFAQWSGTKLTMIRDVYLGLRGAGDYVLKIITADGSTYIYAVNAKDASTTKVTVGKGLRARYWAFELISTGQDFDIDTIEFRPVAADRRV